MPLTCPMPVHDMLAEARGYLITLTMGIQSLSQLRARWGDADGDTIRSACPVEVFLGGEKRHADLQAVSEVVGQQDTWHGTQANPGRETLMPPGALHRMRKGRGVILMPGNASPSSPASRRSGSGAVTSAPTSATPPGSSRPSPARPAPAMPRSPPAPRPSPP